MPALLLRLFLALYFAHLLTDFLFQTREMVDAKKRGTVSGYLAHGGIYYVITVLVTAATIPGVLFSGRYQAGFVGLVAIHLLIDIAKISLTGSGRPLGRLSARLPLDRQVGGRPGSPSPV